MRVTARVCAAEQAGDLPHRGQEPVAVHAVEQGADLPDGPDVQLGRGGAPAGGETDLLAARVAVGPGAGDQAVGLEPGQHPAEVAGVDVEDAPQVRDGRDLTLRQLEQQPRLGE